MSDAYIEQRDAVYIVAGSLVSLDSIVYTLLPDPRRSHGTMPIAALSLNIAWEGIYSIHDLANAPGPQAYINLVWALADVVILYTFFRYGRAELPAGSDSPGGASPEV